MLGPPVYLEQVARRKMLAFGSCTSSAIPLSPPSCPPESPWRPQSDWWRQEWNRGQLDMECGHKSVRDCLVTINHRQWVKSMFLQTHIPATPYVHVHMYRALHTLTLAGLVYCYFQLSLPWNCWQWSCFEEKVNPLIQTPPMGQKKVSILVRCPHFRGWIACKNCSWGKKRCPY